MDLRKQRPKHHGGIRMTFIQTPGYTLCTMFPFTVPITVDPGHQRSLQVKAPGFRAVFQSTVSGTLRMRKRKPNEYTALASLLVPPTRPRQHRTAPPQVAVTEIHGTLLSHGIKVKDYGYHPIKVGHLNPASLLADGPSEEARHMHNVGERWDKYRDNMKAAPYKNMSASSKWKETDPRLLPPTPPMLFGGPVVVPTPGNPYVPLYPTHRIPTRFDTLEAVTLHDRRLYGARKVPIPGYVTRRLLSLGPGWVDLSRYDYLDLQELRNYDELLLIQGALSPGGVYPWVSTNYTSRTPPSDVWRHEALLKKIKARQKRRGARARAWSRVGAYGLEEVGRAAVQDAAHGAAEIREGKKRARENDGYGEEDRQFAKRPKQSLADGVAGGDIEMSNGTVVAPSNAGPSGAENRAVDEVQQSELSNAEVVSSPQAGKKRYPGKKPAGGDTQQSEMSNVAAVVPAQAGPSDKETGCRNELTRWTEAGSLVSKPG
ncbi:hypothetical protein C8J57DRAFT_194506 [Mycena rebaudengoi]|nr:hypothetical protein C8J57DRAFT_194506 [Mycena rebaudengoi]